MRHATHTTRAYAPHAPKNKQTQPVEKLSPEATEAAFQVIIDCAVKRAEARRNEPSGEARLALVQRNAIRARADLKAVAVDVARGVPYSQAIAAHGFDHLTFTGARLKDNAFGMCFNAAQEIRDKRLGDKCLEAFAKLLEGDTPNVKAVLAGMEHLCGDKWKRGSGEHGGGGGGAHIVYNIQLLHAPRAEKVALQPIECENRARITAEDDVIEVEP